MNPYAFLRSIAIIFISAITAFAAEPASRPPNLIVILTDDQGYGDVGFNGCKDIPTPNLDSIARDGVRFPNGYVAYSVCSPSRAALLSGRYGQRFGYERNPNFEPNNPGTGLPLSERTLADVLGKVGYKSGVIGKWHIGAHPDLHPLKRGFTEFFGHLGGGHQYFPESLTIRSIANAKTEADSYRLWIERDHEPVKTTGYLTDEFSDEAVRFVERHKSEPFFLYLAYNAPHAPLQASGKYLSRFPDIRNKNRKTYAAMVSAVDDGVGKLLEKVHSLGLDENTLIFYLSDNGGPESANSSDNGPLRGEKGGPWEGGIRVPFACRWSGHIPGRQVFEKPVISLDIFATITALAKAPVDPARPLDGVNLMPYLTGKADSPPHEALYLRMKDKGAYTVRKGDHKMIIEKSGSPAELYDLTKDPGERNNIAASHPEQMSGLEKLRKEWDSQLIDPIFEGLRMNKPKKNGSPKGKAKN